MTIKRILHVDDDEDLRTIVNIALSVIGQFELLQCSDGPSAVAQAEAFKPDLLLLDVMMPGMSGQQVKAEIDALPGLNGVPAIFVTAKVEDEFTETLMASGAMAVITKPFDPITLADRISEICAGQTAPRLRVVANG